MTASAFFGRCQRLVWTIFHADQLGVWLNFDVDVKNSAVPDVDGTNTCDNGLKRARG